MISRYILLISLLLLSSCLDPGKAKDPAKVVASMSDAMVKKHTTVPFKTVEEVKPTSEFVLVDVRTKAERDVSYIGRSISKEEFEANRLKYINKEILFYCTIGVRSTQYAIEKMRDGFIVFVLKGGVLSWAHAGRTFVGPNNEETKKVHVYSEAWNLLPKDYEGIFDK